MEPMLQEDPDKMFSRALEALAAGNTQLALAQLERALKVTDNHGAIANDSVVVTPGNGVMGICPVSVCHQVSTIGVRSAPMCSRYHSQASGLIGSPTDPSRRSDDRSCAAGQALPKGQRGDFRVVRPCPMQRHLDPGRCMRR